ncbi:hypothetical protein PSCLAVI8L_130758 [Pseudoclavibacter sp. 8L]|nr:hypothetical protein PSCLAVI8L_130758 [Pseudoclavibacter sp. 8L]
MCGRPTVAPGSVTARTSSQVRSWSPPIICTMRSARETRDSRTCCISASMTSSAGSMRYPSTCTLAWLSCEENSMPGMKVMPTSSAAARACAQPAVVSWSVSATASRPALAACRMTSPGASVPSETTEWVWRSMPGLSKVVMLRSKHRARMGNRHAPPRLPARRRLRWGGHAEYLTTTQKILHRRLPGGGARPRAHRARSGGRARLATVA